MTKKDNELRDLKIRARKEFEEGLEIERDSDGPFHRIPFIDDDARVASYKSNILKELEYLYKDFERIKEGHLFVVSRPPEIGKSPSMCFGVRLNPEKEVSVELGRYPTEQTMRIDLKDTSFLEVMPNGTNYPAPAGLNYGSRIHAVNPHIGIGYSLGEALLKAFGILSQNPQVGNSGFMGKEEAKSYILEKVLNLTDGSTKIDYERGLLVSNVRDRIGIGVCVGGKPNYVK